MAKKENYDNILKGEKTEKIVNNKDQLMYIDEHHINRINLNAMYTTEIAQNYMAGKGSIKIWKTTGSSKQICISNRSTQTTTTNNCEQPVYNPFWSTGADVGDVVCFGAISLIVLLLLSILIIYVFKDNERDIET
jgi:hypothetical protein